MQYHQIKQITLASAIAVACTMPLATTTDAKGFLKFDGIDGESVDDKHKNEIDVR